MKKMNKKGFTLIELLAVIVILAIIMVIAVPQILDIISSSRASAWDSNVKLIDEAIELNTTLGSTQFADFSLSSICAGSTDTDITEDIATIADISSDDTTVTCKKNANGKYSVTISPKENGQFEGQKSETKEY